MTRSRSLAGLGAGLAIGLIAAVIPRSVVNAAPNDVLRSSRGSAGDLKATATRTGLVVAQVAIALVLLVGAGLLVRTVQHLSQRELGFNSEGLTWFQVNLPGRKYQEREAQLQFERDVIERVSQIPGVQVGNGIGRLPAVGRHDGRPDDERRCAGHRAPRGRISVGLAELRHATSAPGLSPAAICAERHATRRARW